MEIEDPVGHSFEAFALIIMIICNKTILVDLCQLVISHL